MAGEIAAERILAPAYAAKRKKPNGFNLAADRNRNLYNTHAAKTIENEPFWAEFTASAQRRNKAVHAGLVVDKADAELSLQACQALVSYLGQ
jgi:hypothetical protein